ncbi:MAG TPA: TIGR03960 family B12-binding radical SAM protein [Anaerolineaceae bacterium]|nr:TIGR03960 family B12-binding radical SAM protein [Anaerolineaceae bacterium]
MLSSFEIKERLERILLRVQKPGRYVGGELNQVEKPWDSVYTHIGLIFPDLYDLGLSNLGLTILYETLNNRADVLAERAYSPWLDMEEMMRQAEIPLYTLESKHALADFDMIGFSLPYETLYTNTLNLLDLAQIPIFSNQRSSQHPLIIAGGHACYNPEPMSAFIDAFVIGEGEEVIHDIVDAYQIWKKMGSTRPELLKSLSQIWGVYVPSLYSPRYQPDGKMIGIDKLLDQAPYPIRKRILGKLPPPPTHFLVPTIDVVQNRISVEIMRGCTRGCRFCHAGMITRPVRERSTKEIVDAIQESLDNTGFEEIALLSLSSSDYSQILELIPEVSRRFAGQHVSISLPSLRIDSFSVDLMEQLKNNRQGGFTLAPEAATERMRNIINKPISTQQLLETVRAIYSRDWQTIKLYFMIGHPSETLEDVYAIADLCKAVIVEGRKVIGKRANLHVGVSTFVPKPHTPFQWVACDRMDQIKAKQQLLKKELTGPGMKYNWTDPEETLLEAWLSRGDRRMGEVIYRAWQLGAKFDAWQDQYHLSAWQEGFRMAGLDPDFYTYRQRFLDEIFPWDHISPGVRKSYLAKEYQRSMAGTLQPDCREQCCACGVLPDYAALRRQYPGKGWKCPDVSPRRTQPRVLSPES